MRPCNGYNIPNLRRFVYFNHPKLYLCYYKNMTYVALLRGINVGGKNKVDMAQLKALFERLGLESVKTYINSGNVVFQDSKYTKSELPGLLEAEIEKEYGFSVKVLIRTAKDIEHIVTTLPDSWVNDATMKCDVMFLWEDVDSPKVLDQLTIKSGIDEVKYVPGTILWCVDKKLVTRSGLMKIVGSELYQHMTIRNCNTVRKLHGLMQLSATK